MYRRSTIPFALVALLATVALVPAARAGSAKSTVTVTKLDPLTFGLTGYSGADEALVDSAALQKYLSTKLNRDVTTRIFSSPSELATGLATGKVDLAWMQPFTFVEAQKQGAVVPLAKALRRGLPFYHGVLFTLASHDVKDLNGLKGMSVAWVDKSSAAGYVFPRALLASAGIKLDGFFKTETFEGDHASVCKAVLAGTADVGATYADDRPGAAMAIDGCVQSVGPDFAKALKIVKSTEPIPNDAIAARPGLDKESTDSVTKAFLGLAKDKKGQPLLLGVFKADGFDTVDNNDFMPVKFAAETLEKK